MARAAMHEKAEMSMFMFCKLEENSTMESIHSPKPRMHCNRCRTTPLQKISFPSTGLDLQGRGQPQNELMDGGMRGGGKLDRKRKRRKGKKKTKDKRNTKYKSKERENEPKEESKKDREGEKDKIEKRE